MHDYAKLDRMLDKTKGMLFFMKKAGFLGSLLCSHDFKWRDDIPTAACNGETVFFNPDFYLSLTPGQRVFVLAHEIWHTGYDHMGRMGKKDKNLWNQAADFVINWDLKQSGYELGSLEEWCCIDPQFAGMSTEQVYDLLEKQAVKVNIPSYTPPCQNGSGGAGQPQPAPGGSQPALGGDLEEYPGSPAKAKEATMRKLVQARQASQMAKEAGAVPAEMEELIEDFLNPVLPWETLLYRYFNEMDQSDYSWRRPSRRFEEEYLPSLYSDNGLEHLIYYIDVSGSVSQEQVRRFFTEVRYIHTQLQPKLLTVVTFDTKIHDVYEFEQDQSFEEFTIHGRGGTSLTCVHDHIKKHNPSAAVIFSDLYVPPMEKDPGSPIIWVILDHEQAVTHFGTRIHLKAEDI